MKSINPAKRYVIQNKLDTVIVVAMWRKTRGENMKESLAMLLKTNIEKMSAFRSLAMLMKTNNIKFFSGDVDEKEGSY